MKAFGHNVYIVASVVNQSGTGGTVVYTKEKNLTADSEFGKSAQSILFHLVTIANRNEFRYRQSRRPLNRS